MIQRIQSVFLALAVALNIGVYFTPIYTRAIEDPQQWIGYGFAISLIISALITAGSIFLYKNRKNQILWIKRAMFVQVIVLGFCAGVILSLGGIGTYLWDEAVGSGLALFAFAFQMLAVRFINKDEKLVRSMDRIR